MNLLKQNPCRKCPHSIELKGKRHPRYNSVCGECEEIVKHRNYLKTQRKFIEGEKIKSIEELLKQEWVMWFHTTKHISVFKNMQLKSVLKFLDNGAFHYAIKKCGGNSNGEK